MLFDKIQLNHNINPVKRLGYTLQLISFLLLFLMTAILPAVPQSGSINLHRGLNLLGISIDPNQTITVLDLINQLGGVDKITHRDLQYSLFLLTDNTLHWGYGVGVGKSVHINIRW